MKRLKKGKKRKFYHFYHPINTLSITIYHVDNEWIRGAVIEMIDFSGKTLGKDSGKRIRFDALRAISKVSTFAHSLKDIGKYGITDSRCPL